MYDNSVRKAIARLLLVAFVIGFLVATALFIIF
jgi:hypothetical protein